MPRLAGSGTRTPNRCSVGQAGCGDAPIAPRGPQNITRVKVVGGGSQFLLLCVPHFRRHCCVTQSAGWSFNTWVREEASRY